MTKIDRKKEMASHSPYRQRGLPSPHRIGPTLYVPIVGDVRYVILYTPHDQRRFLSLFVSSSDAAIHVLNGSVAMRLHA